MATRAAVVAEALKWNGFHDGQGYDELTPFVQFYGINYGIAYCDAWVSYIFHQVGAPLPRMGTWISEGSQYCPQSWAYAVDHGATRHPSQAEPGDQVIFNWLGNSNAIGPQSHTEIVTGRSGNLLYTIGANSGPSNVDGYRGTGGVHRHVWNAYDPLIEGVINTSKLVRFDDNEEFVMDAEAKAAFAHLEKVITDNVSQLVKVFEGDSPATKKFGIEGIKDLDKKLSHVAEHLGVKWQ